MIRRTDCAHSHTRLLPMPPVLRRPSRGWRGLTGPFRVGVGARIGLLLVCAPESHRVSFVFSPSRCHRVIASVRPRESTQLLLGRSSPLTVNCLRATIFSVLLYKGFISGSVASRPCKATKLKSAYAASFRELKSAIRRSCMYGAPVRCLTVFLSGRSAPCFQGGAPI